MQTSGVRGWGGGSSVNFKSGLVEGVGAVVVRRRVELGSPKCPGTTLQHPCPGRRPVQGVAALSPRRNAAPAASVQVPALTRAPRCRSDLTARGDAGSCPRSGSRGCDAEAGAEEARRARPHLFGPREPIGARGRRARALPPARARTPLAGSRLSGLPPKAPGGRLKKLPRHLPE